MCERRCQAGGREDGRKGPSSCCAYKGTAETRRFKMKASSCTSTSDPYLLFLIHRPSSPPQVPWLLVIQNRTPPLSAVRLQLLPGEGQFVVEGHQPLPRQQLWGLKRESSYKNVSLTHSAKIMRVSHVIKTVLVRFCSSLLMCRTFVESSQDLLSLF